MAKRILPFIKQQPINFHLMIDEARKLKLFLINEINPFCFEFKTVQGNKIKVELGQFISCSVCQKKDQCTHTIFVLLKIFKRDVVNFKCYKQNDHLLWQKSYTKQELQQLQNSRKNINLLYQDNMIETKKTEQEDYSNRHTIEQDQVCAICHEDFNQDSPITFCKQNCGTNFHNKCLQIWCDHQQNLDNQMFCPICRFQFKSNIIQKLEQEELLFDQKYLKHTGFKCNLCSKKSPIVGKLFKCIFCIDYNLCENCYIQNKHDHQSFLVKEKNNQQWVPVFKQNENQLIKCDFIREIFQGSSLAQNDMINFLVQSFQKLKKNYNNKSTKNENDEYNCQKCGLFSKQINTLFCGHQIDNYCLEEQIRLENQYNYCKCPICNKIIFPGYQNINKINIQQKEDNIIIQKSRLSSLNKIQNDNLKRLNQKSQRDRIQYDLPVKLQKIVINKKINQESYQMDMKYLKNLPQIYDLNSQQKQINIQDKNKLRYKKLNDIQDNRALGLIKRKIKTNGFLIKGQGTQALEPLN